MTETPTPALRRLSDWLDETPRTALRVWSDWPACEGIDRTSLILTPWAGPKVTSGLMRPYIDNPLGVARAESQGDADVTVLPFEGACLLDQPYGPANAKAVAYARQFVADAARAKLPTMVVVAGDSSRTLPVEFDVVLRHSVDAAGRTNGTYCLPGWYDAAQSIDPSFEVRPSPRAAKPRIGFVGQAGAAGGLRGAVTRGRRLAKQLVNREFNAAYRAVRPPSASKRPGVDYVDSLRLRQRVLAHFEQTGAFDTQFVVRDSFYFSIGDKDKARRDFVDNMIASDYVLCVRGFGNYSFRFYDALSHGRVPVLIDTDCALPFDHAFDYASILPVIPLHKLDCAEEILLRHYRSYSDAQWVDLQHALRRLYVSLLSPQSYFGNLGRIPKIRTLQRGDAV